MEKVKPRSLEEVMSLSFYFRHDEYIENVERSIAHHHEYIWSRAVQFDPSASQKTFITNNYDPNDAYYLSDDALCILNQETIQTLYIDYFSNINRDSALIILIASFERHLKDICIALEAHDPNEIKLSLSDIKGDSSVIRAAKYLEKVIGINAGRSSQQDCWKNVHNLFQIRHKIAHTGGSLNLDQPQVDWLKKNGYDAIQEGFLIFTLKCINEYEQLLSDGIGEKYFKPADEDLDPHA